MENWVCILTLLIIILDILSNLFKSQFLLLYSKAENIFMEKYNFKGNIFQEIVWYRKKKKGGQ